MARGDERAPPAPRARTPRRRRSSGTACSPRGARAAPTPPPAPPADRAPRAIQSRGRLEWQRLRRREHLRAPPGQQEREASRCPPVAPAPATPPPPARRSSPRLGREPRHVRRHARGEISRCSIPSANRLPRHSAAACAVTGSSDPISAAIWASEAAPSPATRGALRRETQARQDSSPAMLPAIRSATGAGRPRVARRPAPLSAPPPLRATSPSPRRARRAGSSAARRARVGDNRRWRSVSVFSSHRVFPLAASSATTWWPPSRSS